MNEGWFKSTWRPALGWVYVSICLFDFIIAPIMWSIAQGYAIIETDTNQASLTQQWEPLTLKGGGLLHIAFGSVIGVTSYGRTREKLEGVAGKKV